MFLEVNIYTSVKIRLIAFPPFFLSSKVLPPFEQEQVQRGHTPQPIAFSSTKDALPSRRSAKSNTRDMVKKNQVLLVQDISTAGAT